LRQKPSRQHDPKSRLKSSQVKPVYSDDPSQGNSTNYYIILVLRDKAAREVLIQSSMFIFISSSSAGELFALNQSEAMFAELGEYFQKMLIEAFLTLNIASSQFDEANVRPIKN